MIQTIRNAWRVPELKKKMLFTIMALLIFRLGSAIPVPYIDGNALQQYLDSQSGTILSLMNAMNGSAFSMATVFALSIQPYINSSIIIQLLTVAIPALERLAREGGEEGRKKIASITGQPLQSGDGHGEQLDDDGAVDIGLDAQGEDGGHGEGGAVHGAQQAKDGARHGVKILTQRRRIHEGGGDHRTQPEHQQGENGEEDLVLQLGDLPGVL